MLHCEPCRNPTPCHLQHVAHILKPCFWQIVKVHEPVLELSAVRGILDGESDLLQSDPAMVVLAKDFSTGQLQRAEEAPLAVGRVVCALAIIFAIPGGFVFQDPDRPIHYAEVFHRSRAIRSLDPPPAKARGAQCD
jgi:hypothetical protein